MLSVALRGPARSWLLGGFVAAWGLGGAACTHDPRLLRLDGAARDGASDAAGDAVADARDAAPVDRADAAVDGADDACAEGSCPDAAQIAAGVSHACARMSDGTVYCWGSTGYTSNLLGNGTRQDRVVLAPVIGLTGATGLAVGEAQSCALVGRAVRCWGRSNPLIATVPGLSDVTEVAVGRSGGHACAIVPGPTPSENTVRCWGENGAGQLGDGTTARRDTPVTVREASGGGALMGVTQVVTGGLFTCVRLADLTVRCWGLNDKGQCGDGGDDGGVSTPRLHPRRVLGLANVAFIAAGDRHACAVTMAGTALCWGDNNYHQRGAGATALYSSPVPVTAAGAALTNVVRVSAGLKHTCALMVGGAVRCWGTNDEGQLGTAASTPFSREPLLVSELIEPVEELSAGRLFTCARFRGRAIRCWGSDREGQLGDDSAAVRLPATVTGLTEATQVAAGELHTCAVVDGGVRCWGDNNKGQLGDGAEGEGVIRHAPEAVPELTGVTAVALGFQHTCAHLADRGTVRCWGRDEQGQLGACTPEYSGANVRVPQPVLDRLDGGPLTDVEELSARFDHVCARMARVGTARCWGENRQGQLGERGGMRLPRNSTPLAVSGLEGLPPVRQVAMGPHHTCALLEGGRARCWGTDYEGSLGTGAGTNLTPTVVLNLTSASRLALGDESTCALLASGAVQCWGRGGEGQLGLGSLSPRSSPSADGSGAVANARQVVVGAYHACALLMDTSVRCWGLNNYGQLGDGTVVTRSAPAPVSGLTNVDRLTAGGYHTCARMTDGTVRCWGRNTNGQAGHPAAAERHVPRLVVWR